MNQARGDLSILLLEDDDADAYLTKRELQSDPRVSKIVRAKDGRDAIAMLEAGHFTPSLVFVDLQMPTMDGFEFLAECLMKGLANVPMVVLTSSSARQDAVRSRVHGAVEVIIKPGDVNELRRLLRGAIDRFVPTTAAPSRDDSPVWSFASMPASSMPARPAAPAASAPKPFGRRAPSTAS